MKLYSVFTDELDLLYTDSYKDALRKKESNPGSKKLKLTRFLDEVIDILIGKRPPC